MFRFLRPHLLRPLSRAQRHEWRDKELQLRQTLSFSQDCKNRLKKITRVAVVGGGLAGLMAARRLGQHGIKVTVYEARKQVGGRVLSNETFSNGRITEEGAELIGSFHLTWLALALEYGLAMISRMDEILYEREGLNVKLMLDKELSMKEIKELGEEMETRVLKPIARDASQIRDPSQPWLDSTLKKYDNMSVAYALENIYKVKRTELLWKALEFLLVNDEVAPLDEMNFLGLLCKVKGGQGRRFGTNDTNPMGYWDELEIFRCADGCQKLATEMAKEIKTKYGVKILLNRAVTHINILSKPKQLVTLGSKEVINERDGKLSDGPPNLFHYDYVILAIPPSVWAGVKITADGKKADPKDEDEFGLMSMNPAVKFFSDVKERFWIKEKAAPYGGSLTIGQVWEGTDNQTRVGNQGIVLSVFAGPILPGGRVPMKDQFKTGLIQLYPGYTRNLNKNLFSNSNWPSVPFIKTGYASPKKGEIFKIGKKLSEPFHGRLFFAGEHTRMDFFGYMEGALLSGEDAAKNLMLQSCGLLKEPAPASPSLPTRIASAAPIRKKTAFEHEIENPLEEHSSADYQGEAESPFLDQELFVKRSGEKWEPRAAALATESPFVGALEEYQSKFDEEQLEEEGVPDKLEGEEELEAEEVWEELEEEQLTPQADQEENESLDDEGAPLREGEMELESPRDIEKLYGHEHELDHGEELAELKETEGLESDEEELDWLTEDSGGEESERDEEEAVEAELQTPKRRAKKSSLHSIPTTDIFMHVYFINLDSRYYARQTYTRQQFFDWIVGQSPGEMGPNRFQLAGVEIKLVTDSSTAVSDFKGSLKTVGSVVVYLGHMVLGPKTGALGLNPWDPGKKKPDITCAQLTNLLNAAKAKIVVLASCASSQCVTKIKGDTVVIVTESGKDRETNSLQWALAIKTLLDKLLDNGTVGDALAAANKTFAKVTKTERFKMINGDPTLKMI